MEKFIGVPASPGYAIGEAYIYNQDVHIPRYSISTRQVEFEVDRFYVSLRKTKMEYEKLRDKIVSEMSEDEGKFLDAHILMTEDQVLIQDVVEKIRTEKMNVEWVVYQVTDQLVKKFSAMENEYFRDRAGDIWDIGRKILQKLLVHNTKSLADLDKEVIVVSSDLTVSDTASMRKEFVLGFITQYGGRTSHSAILARALGIPLVLGINDIAHKINTGDTVIVDGIKGVVIINPDEEELKNFAREKDRFEKREKEFFSIKDLITDTIDGKRIVLKANMEIPEQEIDSVLKYGAEGVGLYRSEFLYLSKKNRILPTEEEQFLSYKFILEKFTKGEVTIRTLDLGGDKIIQGVTDTELNPNLGWRAIRFCLSNRNIFETQLRALLRASIYGDLSIMFPLITCLDEVISAKEILAEVKESLNKEGITFKKDIKVGIMIETPSAAILSDVLAKHVDFFSIGTNDLIQYIMACDRDNEKINHLFQPLHPAVLRSISMIINNAHENGIKVSVCGEMASELLSIPIFVGMGVDELSMSSKTILETKKMIRNINFAEAAKLVTEVLTYTNSFAISSRITEWLKDNLGSIISTF